MRNSFKNSVKKKVIAVLLCAAAVTAVSAGCSLAQPDKGQTQADQLIGMYVTKEYVEEQGETVFGEKRDDGTFQFPVAGYGLYMYLTGDQMTSVCDSAVTACGTHVSAGKDSATVSYEGTLHVREGSRETYFAYEVYQTADEKVYLRNRTGASSYDGLFGGTKLIFSAEGVQHDLTERENPSTGVSFQLNISGVPEMEKLIFKEFDENDRLLRATSMEKGAVRKTLKKQKDTAYIIAEVHTADGISRSLCEDGSAAYYEIGSDGFARQNTVEIP